MASRGEDKHRARVHLSDLFPSFKKYFVATARCVSSAVHHLLVWPLFPLFVPFSFSWMQFFLNFKSMNEFMGRLILIETLKEYY